MRFPGFTDEWKERPLNQLVERVIRKNKNEESKIALTISAQYGLVDQEAFFNNKVASSDLSHYYLLYKGEYAYNKSYSSGYPWGTVKRLNNYDKGVVSPLYICFRPLDTVDSDFIGHYFESSKWHKGASEIAVEGARNHGLLNIGVKDFFSTTHFVPSLDEQKKIASILSVIDERIATQNKIIDNLQSLIKGLNDSFHDGIQGTPISFDQIGRSYSGLSGKSGDDFGQGSPFITYLNVYQNNIVNEKQIDLVAIDANESQNTVSYGDVLFTLSSETPEETGIGCVYLGSSGKYYLNSFCFGVTITHPDKVYPPYLAYLVSSSKFRKFVYPIEQGSTRFNLQRSDFMRKQFTLLPIEKQKEIATILDTLNNRLSVECKLNELYKSQKDYLLRKLFI